MPPAPCETTITPKFPVATGAFGATGISYAIHRQRIAGKRHSESEPVTKRGAVAAGVGYQRATGNDSPVSASSTAIVRYPTFQGGAATAVGAIQRTRIKGRRPTGRLKTAGDLIPVAIPVLQT